jgi:hypothetical protein
LFVAQKRAFLDLREAQAEVTSAALGNLLCSGTPLLICQRRGVQLAPYQPPLGQLLVEHHHEAIRMVALKKMRQLMHDHIF